MSDSTSSVPATLGTPSTPSTPDVSIGSTTNLCTSDRSVISRPSRSDKMLLITHAKSISVQNSFEKKKQELSASQSASTEVHASNADLYAQLQEERRKNKKMRKELDLLKKYVNFNASSSDELSSQEDNQGSENESDDDFDNVNESGSDPDNTNESDKS
ncbi:suppressor protein SRP40-like isoform X5 [Nicotiana sylvestris]|uniref:suppressor protein SRP40-like isoform X5 n=1 Tax=Nicotiana sylvestris TaxID=4096 RepID=UPI00388C8319